MQNEIVERNEDLPAGAEPLNGLEGQMLGFRDFPDGGTGWDNTHYRPTQAILPDLDQPDCALWPAKSRFQLEQAGVRVAHPRYIRTHVEGRREDD